MSHEESRKELLQRMVNKVSEVMAIMEMFESSRAGSIAFTHLEEGLMWLQVLAHNVPLKPSNIEVKEQENVQIVIDAEQ